MLHNVNDLRGYTLRAIDGVIGRVSDFYFDDEDWGIRYLVVDTLGHAGWMARQLPVALTRSQVETQSTRLEDCRLRSSNVVNGQNIEATDGGIGHVKDLMVDDHTGGDSLPHCGPEQVVGRSAGPHLAAIDQRRELVGGLQSPSI